MEQPWSQAPLGPAQSLHPRPISGLLSKNR